MAQTIENSCHSTSEDMGDSHIEIHSGQRTRLVDGEPFIETLSNNKSSDSSYDLMKVMAHRQGVKSEAEWKKYNTSIRPARRKNSYDAYLASLCNKFVGGLQKRLDNPKTPRSKRASYAQQLVSIEKNRGVPLDGSLFYLSNFHDYDLHKKDYKQYRAFERATFEDFYRSKDFKALCPGCFRAEIHFDELGTMHLQTQSIWFKTDKSGRAMYTKRGCLKKVLANYYGSTKELNRRLDLLSWVHGDPNLKRQPGSERIDARLNKLVADGKTAPRTASPSERKGRLEELWRIEQLNALCEAGRQNAKKYNVDWQPVTTYQTDGIHRTRDAYIQHEQVTEQVADANKKGLISNSRELSSTNRELEQAKADLVAMRKETKRVQSRLSSLTKPIDEAFEATTGKKRPDDLDTLGAVRVIRHHVRSAKSDKEKAQQEHDELLRENKRLRQEQVQLNQFNARTPWYRLRQLIVDIIEALLPVLVKLARDGVYGQQWRDSVTEQVDRQMRKSPILGAKKPTKGKNNDLER